jgi:hypothetical protein
MRVRDSGDGSREQLYRRAVVVGAGRGTAALIWSSARVRPCVSPLASSGEEAKQHE